MFNNYDEFKNSFVMNLKDGQYRPEEFLEGEKEGWLLDISNIPIIKIYKLANDDIKFAVYGGEFACFLGD